METITPRTADTLLSHLELVPLSSYTATLGDYSVKVRSDDDGAISWCNEFLSPYFGAKRTAPGQRILNADFSYRVTGRYTSPEDSQPVRLFFGRTGKRFRLTSDIEGILDDEKPNLYLKTGRRVAACLDPGESDSFQIPARLAREALVAQQMATGALRIHGGVCYIHGQGYLVFGPSACGKTATIFLLLRAGARSLCCNDRVLVKRSNGEVNAYGVPIFSKIGIEIISWFPQLASLLPTPKAIAEHFVQATNSNGRFLKYALSPQLLSKRLKLDIQPATPLKGVIVPDLRDDPLAVGRICPISRHERRPLLLASVLDPDPAFPDTFYQPDQHATSRDSIDSLTELPWVRVYGDYSDSSLATQLQDFFR